MGSFTAAAATWQSFYLLVAAAAATLIGLMFVAVTFGSSLVTVKTSGSARAFLDPTLTHFVQVLVTGCLIVIPTMSPVVLGILLLVLGVLRLAALFRIYRHMREAHRTHNDLELSDWLSGVVLPLAAYLTLIGTGAAFLRGQLPFNFLAIVTLAILLNGIYGAWELMVWMAISRTREK